MSPGPWLRAPLAALVFLTRLPVPIRLAAEDFRAASAGFAIVGAGIGALVGLVHRSAHGLGIWPAACLASAFAMLLTGAMHEDGLADSADALLGARDRASLFAILKDPRIGSFGACALLAVVSTRIACIGTLPADALAAFVAAHGLGRFACTASLAALPYVSAEGVSRSASVASASAPHVLTGLVSLALVFGALAHAGLAPARTLLVAAATALAITVALGAWFRARAGGLTGDFLGATEQLVELGVWLAFVALRS